MFGRGRVYNLGVAIFAPVSVLLSLAWMHGTAAAWWLIAMRVLQGVGGAMLMANSSAILTDAFPVNERGLALGMNEVAGIAGSFSGLVLGGVLGPLGWRYIFLVSVPFGVIGTIWSYLKLRELGIRRPARLDWAGNLTFGAGLIAVLAGITYGIQPYGGDPMGWASPPPPRPRGGRAAVPPPLLVVQGTGRAPRLPAAVGHGHGPVRLAEPGRHHEQPPARSARRRRRHERDVPELGPGAVHRDLLHADHPGPGLVAARHPHPRPGGAGSAARGRGAGGRTAAGVDHVRGAARLQPGPDAARARPQRAPGEPRRLPHRPHVLPVALLSAALTRPGHRRP